MVELNIELLTVQQSTTITGLSRGRTYQLIREGRLPACRISPRSIRIPRSALESWLAERNTEARRVLETAG